MNIVHNRRPVTDRNPDVHRGHSDATTATVATAAEGVPGQTALQRPPGQPIDKVQVVVVQVVAVVDHIIRGMVIGHMRRHQAHRVTARRVVGIGQESQLHYVAVLRKIKIQLISS